MVFNMNNALHFENPEPHAYAMQLGNDLAQNLQQPEYVLHDIHGRRPVMRNNLLDNFMPVRGPAGHEPAPAAVNRLAAEVGGLILDL